MVCDINELTSQLDDSLNQKVDAGFWTALRQRKTRICGRKICLRHGKVGASGRHAGDIYVCRFVRRGLQDAGFTMQKRKGFGANGKCFAG